MKLYSNVPWKEQGFWIFHFDTINIDAAWRNVQELYLSQQLKGVIRISLANRARDDSKAFFCFVGPAENKQHCLEAGKLAIGLLNYTRQKCHQSYEAFVYYKLRNVKEHLYHLAFE